MSVVSSETSGPKSSPAWDAALLRDPHHVADKSGRVRRMFAAIAPSYDLNNRLHSLWMDQRWRGKALGLADLKASDVVVDVACGTGDLTLAFENMLDWLCAAGQEGRRPRVIGIDFTFEMLPLARRKSRFWEHADRPPPGVSNLPGNYRDPVHWINGDAQALPLPDACCDVVSIAFGIRNVADPAKAIAEFFRVLRPGGRLIVLEFSLPTNPLLRGLYNFYFRKVLPRTATLISGDKTGAYKYLPESVNTFIGRRQMVEMMGRAGFARVEQFPMTFGVCVCYRGIREA